VSLAAAAASGSGMWAQYCECRMPKLNAGIRRCLDDRFYTDQTTNVVALDPVPD